MSQASTSGFATIPKFRSHRAPSAGASRDRNSLVSPTSCQHRKISACVDSSIANTGWREFPSCGARTTSTSKLRSDKRSVAAAGFSVFLEKVSGVPLRTSILLSDRIPDRQVHAGTRGRRLKVERLLHVVAGCVIPRGFPLILQLLAIDLGIDRHVAFADEHGGNALLHE